MNADPGPQPWNKATFIIFQTGSANTADEDPRGGGSQDARVPVPVWPVSQAIQQAGRHQEPLPVCAVHCNLLGAEKSIIVVLKKLLPVFIQLFLSESGAGSRLIRVRRLSISTRKSYPRHCPGWKWIPYIFPNIEITVRVFIATICVICSLFHLQLHCVKIWSIGIFPKNLIYYSQHSCIDLSFFIILQKAHGCTTVCVSGVRPILCVAEARARTHGQVSRRRHLAFILRQDQRPGQSLDRPLGNGEHRFSSAVHPEWFI